MNYIFAAIFAAQAYFFLMQWQDEENPNAIYKFLGRSSIVAAVISLLSSFTHDQLFPAYLQTFVYGCCGWAVCWFLVTFAGGDDDEESDKDHIRGSKLASAESLGKLLKGSESRLNIGGVPIPLRAEDRSILLAGAPGTGKSQAIMANLDALAGKGHRAVVADASGIFYSRYFGQGKDKADVLLNPFDQRSVAWSPLSEIEAVEDCASMTKSMIPDGFGSAAEWNGYAQSILQPLLEHCWTERLNNAELFRLACIANVAELRQVLSGTAAAPLVEVGNEKMFGSVRAILSSYLKSYQYLQPDVGVDSFSIRKYLKEGEGWLFITYKQTQRDALRPIIQAALDVAARTVLDMPHTTGDRAQQKKTWFVLDEFPLLGNLQSVETLLTNGSKHGSVVMAGIQTIAQLRETYGHDKAQTLLATLGTWLCLRVADAETSEYMSKSLGDSERKRVVKSGGENKKVGIFGFGTNNGMSQNENWQEQISTQKTVLPSEFQNLPDLCGYLKITGDFPICPVKLPIVQLLAEAAPSFIAAPPRPRVKVVSDTPEAVANIEPQLKDDVFTL